METVANKYISVAYKLYAIDEDGRDFTEEATAEKPFEFISGLGMTLEAFEEQVKDLDEGAAFDFTLNRAEAYGDYDDEHVVELPKHIFEVDGKFDAERIVEGNVIPLMTADGQRISGSVEAVKDNVVVMDLNHPLAGCDLNFVGSVVASRPATNEELAEVARMMSGGCGCGCGCDHEGCDHDHDGCGCDQPAGGCGCGGCH
ncbi:MAG: FKBP-type peptidyl-prolyl cis-trans isomerase [Prevotellaceae bacterium]|jgi:FKBP-type peptidyl-prolyl cis-trans isomerase SlyD|nr:FKBP-type peptidyl-prolyl cis-trans isomerase [Prevotellaceae bacterium]